MSFADRPVILTPFAASQSPEDLKRIVESATPSSGKPNLAKMFSEAEKLFEEAGARPAAKKFLVVIVDNKSADQKDGLIEAAKPLIETGCWVIPVAVGDNADVEELRLVTPLKKTTVEVPKTGDPDKLADKIADKMKQRECTLHHIIFYDAYHFKKRVFLLISLCLQRDASHRCLPVTLKISFRFRITWPINQNQTSRESKEVKKAYADKLHMRLLLFCLADKFETPRI